MIFVNKYWNILTQFPHAKTKDWSYGFTWGGGGGGGGASVYEVGL